MFYKTLSFSIETKKVVLLSNKFTRFFEMNKFFTHFYVSKFPISYVS